MFPRSAPWLALLWAGLSFASSPAAFTARLVEAEQALPNAPKDVLVGHTERLSAELSGGLLLRDRDLIARWLLVESVAYHLPPAEPTSRDRALRTALGLDPELGFQATPASFRSYGEPVRSAVKASWEARRYAFYLSPPAPEGHTLFVDGQALDRRDPDSAPGPHNPYVVHGAYHLLQVAVAGEQGWKARWHRVSELTVLHGEGQPERLVVPESAWQPEPEPEPVAAPTASAGPTGGCAARRSR